MDDVDRKQQARDLGRRIARLEDRVREWKTKKDNDNAHNQKMIDLLEEALEQTKDTEQALAKGTL